MLVQTKRRNPVEIITINRPEARNAIDYDTSEALADAFDAAEQDPGVWAVVLTGPGDKAFSAGMYPKAVALEMAMTGDPVDAATAQRLGLVNRVVKRSLGVTEDEVFELQGDVLAEVFTSPDAMEGPRAFAEKRAPKWTSA
ncbi:enoyl-CoA hydratase-related protein [Actinomarinicola tropica]|uniref:Enoyl-CoA hydratase n=1 Tax=Actinomarinicola tropica TaxID=2789776 RepID=A0A5Q2RB08_9ACTN|nr:enoyl-CoA hydratase-related protein [Actinomarinicola tropica]QGG94008.1 hypothetical protein GH723_02180 [Actinomarinicola tropica]